VGEAFFQPYPFIASGDVTVLQPRIPLPVMAALFLCTVLYAEKYRWNYGRKWGARRIKESVISLPTTGIGDPDWDLMERAMCAFPLARAILANSGSA
jgi:hypothetical protein